VVSVLFESYFAIGDALLFGRRSWTIFLNLQNLCAKKVDQNETAAFGYTPDKRNLSINSL
jgi:hypothetical protein